MAYKEKAICETCKKEFFFYRSTGREMPEGSKWGKYHFRKEVYN